MNHTNPVYTRSTCQVGMLDGSWSSPKRAVWRIVSITRDSGLLDFHRQVMTAFYTHRHGRIRLPPFTLDYSVL